MVGFDYGKTPIPPVPSIEGREHVPILECGERIVPVRGIDPDRLGGYPDYYLSGYFAASLEGYVRRTGAILLLKAAALIPTDLRLVLLDGWRPTNLQRGIYLKEKRRLQSLHPTLDNDELER